MSDKLYRVVVTETRRVDVIYEIEANSEAEARDKAHIGDTISEEASESTMEVIDRSVISLDEADASEAEEVD
jgi:hypothetical protein